MDADTYRSINHLPSFSKQYQPPLDLSMTDHPTAPARRELPGYTSISDEPYPKVRQCFIRAGSSLTNDGNRFKCVSVYPIKS